MKFVKVFLIIVGLIFVIMQFIPMGLSSTPANSGVDLIAVTQPPVPVAAMLRGACYDCHSQETRWPWYSRVAPVSWWLADHIKEGRKRLDFSDWPVADPKRAKKKLGQIADSVQEEEMPLASYAWMHASARFSAADRKLLTDWAAAEAEKLAASMPHETASE